MADANPNRMDAPEESGEPNVVVVENPKTKTVFTHNNTPAGRPDEEAQVAASRKHGESGVEAADEPEPEAADEQGSDAE